jgi:hypothetical protein
VTFTCKDFMGFNPVGAAAVVTAPDAEIAEAMLREALEKRGLPQGTRTLTLVPMLAGAEVRILVDGEY